MIRRSAGKKRGGNKTPSGNVAKRVTLGLAIFTLILLIIAILLFDQRILRLLSPPIDDPPVVERVLNGEDDSTDMKDITQLEGVVKAQDDPAEDDESTGDDGGSSEQNIVRLFFIRVSDDGKINTKSVLRPIKYDQAPLTATVNALLSGPSPGDLSTDTLSLIPEGTELLGARVSAGIAFLNFNEGFRFNSLGIEGYKAQIEQIVFTATEFSTVNKVQFLIEGKTISYLGGEGVWVGSPLSREDIN